VDDVRSFLHEKGLFESENILSTKRWNEKKKTGLKHGVSVRFQPETSLHENITGGSFLKICKKLLIPYKHHRNVGKSSPLSAHEGKLQTFISGDKDTL
jgi:hypothetical protein